jgi:hypothetical protein
LAAFARKGSQTERDTSEPYFSVVSPNRTFDVGNEILTSINWEEYPMFNEAFEGLRTL